jgi:hypothetical protein
MAAPQLSRRTLHDNETARISISRQLLSDLLGMHSKTSMGPYTMHALHAKSMCLSCSQVLREAEVSMRLNHPNLVATVSYS